MGESHPDTIELRKMLYEYRNLPDVNVRNVSIIILSYNTLELTKQCIESIFSTCYKPAYELIVIDNASNDGSAEYLDTIQGIKLIKNLENIGFPGGCNQGIEASSEGNDIFLLNSDTIMMFNSLFTLRMGLYSEGLVGTAGAVGNCVSNLQEKRLEDDSVESYEKYVLTNNLPSTDISYENRSYLVGFALLIKRLALNEVGVLDERFSPGMYEDVDLGLRMKLSGYRNKVCWNSFIYHYGTKSFNQDPQKTMELRIGNERKLYEKYGFHIQYYNFIRTEIIDLLEDVCGSEKADHSNILEIGCGLGATLHKIKYSHPEAHIHGIEINTDIAKIGSSDDLDILCANIEEINMTELFGESAFDIIICADVIEHLKDPINAILKIKQSLKPGGMLLVSLPNLMHYTVISDLLRGHFPFEASGIRDYTHLHGWVRSNIIATFLGCGFKMIKLISGYMDDKIPAWFNEIISKEECADKDEFMVYQYIFAAQKE